MLSEEWRMGRGKAMGAWLWAIGVGFGATDAIDATDAARNDAIDAACDDAGDATTQETQTT